MKYAVIIMTLYFIDHERQEKFSIKLKNGDEKKQVEEFITGYKNVIKYLNIDDFLYLTLESVSIDTLLVESVPDEYYEKKLLDITKLDI